MIVTKKGQQFKVNISNWLEQDPSGFVFKEGVTYTCTEVIEFEEMPNEVYVGDNWISDDLTILIG